MYQALLDGESPEVRSLGELQELVDEESAYRDSSDYDEDRSYWTERVAGAGTPPSLSLGPRLQDLRRDLRLHGDQKLFGPEINVLTFPNGFELGGHQLIQRYINTGPCDDLTLLTSSNS